MGEIGHNGGPPAAFLTPKTKLECIRSVLERDDITAAQKCIGVGIIVHADKEWTAEVKTGDLQRFASAKDRETVFRATKALDEKRIVAKASGRGQSGRYTVLPSSVIEAVIEAYEEAQSGRDKPDQSAEKWSGETGRHNQSVPTSEPVGIDPTSQVKPDRFDPTGPNTPAPARIESPSGIVISKNNNLSPQTPQVFDDPYQRVVLESGGVKLVNGLRQYWLDRFEGDEISLDLALIEVAGNLQVNSRQPLESQVSSKLARMVRTRLDSDKRYDKAVKRREPAKKSSDLYSAEAIEKELLKIQAESKR